MFDFVSRWAAILFGAFLLFGFAGCSQLADDGGKLDIDRVERLAQIAKDSNSDVELDVSLRPGSVDIVNGFSWNTGIEATARFRWQGEPE